jgi:hypothetical protein
VLVLEEGRLVEDGAPAALAGRGGSRYSALLDAETAAAAALAAPGWRRLRLAGGSLWEDEASAAGALLGPAVAREAAAAPGGGVRRILPEARR